MVKGEEGEKAKGEKGKRVTGKGNKETGHLIFPLTLFPFSPVPHSFLARQLPV